jgi:hypothetical protein
MYHPRDGRIGAYSIPEKSVRVRFKYFFQSYKGKELAMIQLVSQTQLFRTKNGAVSARVQRLHPSVYIVERVLSGSNTVKSGSLLIRNTELKRRSKVQAEWANYSDLYSVLRGMVSALRRGGAQPDVKDGELQELVANPQTLRRCVGLIFSEALECREICQAVQKEIEFTLGTLRNRRVDSLTFAYLDTVRGTRIYDANNRHNPGAAAMALGGAIQQMDTRHIDLRFIMSRLNIRVGRIVDFVYEVVALHEMLLMLVGGRDVKMPSDQESFLRVSDPQAYERPEAERALHQLDSLIPQFCQLVVSPYARNAEHMLADLRGMRIDLSVLAARWNEHYAKDLRERSLRVRQGILWFLARHRLELICAKLSWLLKDVARGIRIVRLAVNGACHESIVLSPQEMERRFGFLVEEMNEYARSLRRCQDHLLIHRVGGIVRAHVDDAIGFAESNDWKEAKKSLDLAASFM